MVVEAVIDGILIIGEGIVTYQEITVVNIETTTIAARAAFLYLYRRTRTIL